MSPNTVGPSQSLSASPVVPKDWGALDVVGSWVPSLPPWHVLLHYCRLGYQVVCGGVVVPPCPLPLPWVSKHVLG